MAIKTEWRDPNGLTGISCLSTDTKPDAPAGSICWETDTGNRFERDGDTWQPSGTGGAARVSLATTLAGEDQTYNLQNTIQGPFYAWNITASAWSDTVEATSFVHNLVFDAGTAGVHTLVANLVIKDGGSAGSTILTIPLGATLPCVFEINLRSQVAGGIAIRSTSASDKFSIIGIAE